MPKEPVALATPDPTAARLAALKALYPDALADGKFDFDKLRGLLEGAVAPGPERFTFSWAGRTDAASMLQTPSRAALVPQPEDSVNWDATRNLFIEGDNLEVLKLLYKPYAGKVKLIYIDPPYNTGQDFVYPDDFADPLAVYLKLTGQADEAGKLLTGNPETSGRYHSAWLSMMYPRLFLARQLLRDDGVIFVSIDDHEVHHLRLLMNEVFGEENYRAEICWQRKYSVSNNASGIASMRDFIMVYARSEQFENGMLPRSAESAARYANPDNDARGVWKPVDYWNQASPEQRPNLAYSIVNPNSGQVITPGKKAWKYAEEVHKKHVEEGRIWWGSDGSNTVPALKLFLNEVRDGLIPHDWWPHTDSGHTDEATKELDSLFDGESLFQTPKPTRLLKKILNVGNVITNDIVLDFFSGSGTTAQAVLELNREDGGNRRFILVQLPEPTGNNTYPTIAEIGKERIRRVINKLNKETPNMLGKMGDAREGGGDWRGSGVPSLLAF